MTDSRSPSGRPEMKLLEQPALQTIRILKLIDRKNL
jgi:hypothetical protein